MRVPESALSEAITQLVCVVGAVRGRPKLQEIAPFGAPYERPPILQRQPLSLYGRRSHRGMLTCESQQRLGDSFLPTSTKAGRSSA